MESLWPKHGFQNPGGYNTLSTVKSQVPLYRASELADLSCCFTVSSVRPMAARRATLQTKELTS